MKLRITIRRLLRGGVQAWLFLSLAFSLQADSFYSMQYTNQPPLPVNFLPELTTYSLGSNRFLIDDLSVDYEQLRLESVPNPPSPDDPPTGGGGGTNTNYYSRTYTSGELWLEIVGVSNNFAYLVLHGAQEGVNYQLQSKTNLADPAWIPGEILFGPNGTNRIDYTPVPSDNPPTMFFRVQEIKYFVQIAPSFLGFDIVSAIEPTLADTGRVGYLTLSLFRSGTNATEDVTVYYQLNGTPINGTDYTNLTGSVVFPAGGVDLTNIYFQAIQDSLIEFEEDILFTLIPTNTYAFDTFAKTTATIAISDNFDTNILQVVAYVDSPVGMDFHPPTSSLITSVNFNNGGISNVFDQINTSGTFPWSNLEGLEDEIKLTIPKKTTNGFTAGEVYFGNGHAGGIGKISANGSVITTNWCTLSPTESLLRGSLYVDQTGYFSNNLIAVTGGTQSDGGGVWMVTSNGMPRQLTNFLNTHLEGLITLTNDVSKYGPWAGKILVGAESALPPSIFAISTNSEVLRFALNIEPEDFHIIPPNQDFYGTARESNLIFKLPRTLLTNYIGDLLVTQAGEISFDHPPRLFIVHWDGTDFIKRSITGFYGEFEHGTFAPIDLPPLP
jgi:hypothetical protein